MEKQYWLGNYKNINQYGWSMDVKLIDGPHDDPKGVREARHIISGIGLDRGENRNYVMVTIENIPEGEINVNEAAIEQNRKIVDKYLD
jgi:hypothetical protein